MDRLLGVEVRVTMRSGAVHVGQIFTVVEELQLVALGNRVSAFKTEYTLLNTAEIAETEVLRSDLPPLLAELPPYEPRSEMQVLSEEINKTYRCNIEGTVLYIPDLRLSISPPYTSVADITGPGGREAVSRLGKVVMIRQLTETRQRLRL